MRDVPFAAFLPSLFITSIAALNFGFFGGLAAAAVCIPATYWIKGKMHGSGALRDGGPGQSNVSSVQQSRMTRQQFEDCLRAYVDAAAEAAGRKSGFVAEPAFAKIRTEIGGVWRLIIDDMYRQYGTTLDSRNPSVDTIHQCAMMLVELYKRSKEGSLSPRPSPQDTF